MWARRWVPSPIARLAVSRGSLWHWRFNTSAPSPADAQTIFLCAHPTQIKHSHYNRVQDNFFTCTETCWSRLPSGANHHLFLLFFKHFQMTTWPALWMVATARTRRKVSGDLHMFVSFCGHSRRSGNNHGISQPCLPTGTHARGRGSQPWGQGNTQFLATMVTPCASGWRVCSSSRHQGRRDPHLPIHLESRRPPLSRRRVCLPPCDRRWLKQGGKPATIG